MKKFLIHFAFVGFVALPLVGCGGSSEPTVVEAPDPADNQMSAADQAAYEEEMAGGGSSAGN